MDSISIADLDNISEYDLLKSPETVIFYDETANLFLTPFCTSIPNLFSGLGLEPFKQLPTLPIHNDKYFLFCRDYENNIFSFKIEEGEGKFKITLPKGEKIEMDMPILYIYPKVLACSKTDRPQELDFTEIIKNYNKNMPGQILGKICEIISLKKELINNNPSYLV